MIISNVTYERDTDNTGQYYQSPSQQQQQVGVSVGVGDMLARLFQWIGIEPCSPCKQRKEMLNRMFQRNRI